MKNGLVFGNTAAQYNDVYSHNGVYELPAGTGDLSDENGVSFDIRLIVFTIVVLMISLVVVFFFYFRKSRLNREKNDMVL